MMLESHSPVMGNLGCLGTFQVVSIQAGTGEGRRLLAAAQCAAGHVMYQVILTNCSLGFQLAIK